jgi:GT2 family glycosyltransferase
MELSIIIVNYNSLQFLQPCLESVQQVIEKLSAEIIVVDNNSTDGSQAFLKKNYPLTIFNNQNIGFAKACNLGLSHSSGKYILFLNPDTVVSKDCFQDCISFFESHHDAGAVGVRMIDEPGKFLKESKRGFPSPATAFYKLFGLSFLFPHSKIFAKYYLGHLPEMVNNPVDALSGAFMMVRKEVLEKTGSFDESFFMYGEDIDLSYRIVQYGYKNYYLGKVTITHKKGGSTVYNYNYIKRFYDAMSLFVKKHYAGKRSSLFIFTLYTGIWFRKMIALIGLLFR